MRRFFPGALVGAATWIDEDSDGDGDVSFGDEVIEDGGGADLSFGVGMAEAVLKDEKGGGFGGVVLRGHVNEVFAVGAGIDLAVVPGVLSDLSFGDVLWEGAGVGRVVFDAGGAGFEGFALGIADGPGEVLKVLEFEIEFAACEVADFLTGCIIKNGDCAKLVRDPICSAVLGPAAGGGKLGEEKGDENRTVH